MSLQQPIQQRFWPRRRHLGLALGALLWGAAGDATTVERVPLAHLVDEAPMIFLGSALDQRVELLPGHTSPTTFVTFAVDETLKGAAEDSSLTLAFEGGRWGEEIFEVAGMPTFETGGRYLLFLRSNGAAGGCPTAGWWQGKMDIVRHPLSGTQILVDHRGIPVEGIGAGEWRKAEVRIDESGLLRSLAGPVVEVQEEDRVTISALPEEDTGPRDTLAAVPGASDVLASLRNLVRQRQGLSSFRGGAVVRSAQGASAGGLSTGSPRAGASAPSLRPNRPVAAPEHP